MPILTPNRRQLLLGTGAALAAAPLLPVSAAHAAAPDAGTAPLRAVKVLHLGRMKVTMIDDALFTFPASAFAANQPEGAVGPFLARFGLPTETVTLHMQVTLIEHAGRKVLIDTGMGDLTFPGNEPDNGRLFASLAALGLSPADITDVVISHGHPDHIGGCSFDGDPAFPTATYHMPPEELEFWSQKPGDEQNFMNYMLGAGNAKLAPLQGMIRPYGDGDEIAPGITAISAPGHTLAHHGFMLADGEAKLLHLVDVAVHYLVATEHPDWALAVEMNPEVAARTRHKLFSRAADEGLLVAGYHFPFPGIGRIVAQDSGGWRFVPMATG